MQQQNPYNQPPMGQMMPPMRPLVSQRPTSRRERLRNRLMLGVAAGITLLPNWFAAYAVATYAIALIGVNLMFSSYAMEWYFWLFGIMWVAGFFFFSVRFSQDWSEKRIRHHKTFEKRMFWTGFGIRVLYVVFIYFFYIEMTGVPHEFASADSTEYIHTAKWL